MKKLLLVAALLCAVSVGHATGNHPSPTPSPTPIPSPPPSTATLQSAATAGAEAAAAVNAAVEARNRATATGGDASATGGDASVRAAIQAALDASNRMDVSLQNAFNTSFRASLSNNSRSELNLAGARLGGDSSASSSTGPVSAGGATVSNSVYSLSIPSVSAQAPGLPSAVGDMKFLMSKRCDRPYEYVGIDQLIIHTRTFVDRDEREPTALYTVKLDVHKQPIVKTYKVLMVSADRSVRIVECEFTRQVLAMENAAGTHGFSLSIGTREGVGAGGNSGGATRSFPTAKYLLPEKGMKRQCLVEGEWVDEDLVGKGCKEGGTSTTEQKPTAIAPPVPGVDALAQAVAAMLAGHMVLSAPAYERRWKPCPPKGCAAPRQGYYVYVRKDGEVKAQVDFNATGRATASPKK